MNRRQIILDVRNSGRLKAMKPCFVYLKPNIGKIYNGKQSDFIMSIRDNTLYFQKVSFFLHHLQPKGDFTINIADFIAYSYTERKMSNALCLYSKKREFIDIFFDKMSTDCIMTVDNISRIIKDLEAKGIKEIKRGEDDGE